jgi:hypothetical protein
MAIDQAAFEAVLTTPELKEFFTGAVNTAKTTAVEEFKTTSETERKKLVPEKYELKIPDGSPLDPKGDADEIAAYARKQNLSADEANVLTEFVHGRVAGLTSRQAAELETTVKAWETETWADKDLGGGNKSQTEQNVKRVLDKFGSADLRTLLDKTGLGSKAEVVRFLSTLGKAMAEDKPGFHGNSPSRAAAGEKRGLYPTLP